VIFDFDGRYGEAKKRETRHSSVRRLTNTSGLSLPMAAPSEDSPSSTSGGDAWENAPWPLRKPPTSASNASEASSSGGRVDAKDDRRVPSADEAGEASGEREMERRASAVDGAAEEECRSKSIQLLGGCK
jgi:hypothetical protein